MPVITFATSVLSYTYRLDRSRIVTSPAGISDVRENGDACDSTGSEAYSVSASAARTTSSCTLLIRSMIGASLYRASTVVSVSVADPTTWLTYSTTRAWSSPSSRVIRGSSATVAASRSDARTDSTRQRPRSRTSSKSNSDSRSAKHSGSDSTTSRPVSSLVTRSSAISSCACPTRIASIPGTCRATFAAAFSTYGSWSPYDDVPDDPECAETTTTSAPIDRSFGTHRAACSSRPGKVSFPCTYALSQIAMPGFVSPSTATLTGGAPFTWNFLMKYGGKAGLSVVASSALAPSSGKSHCSSNLRSVPMP